MKRVAEQGNQPQPEYGWNNYPALLTAIEKQAFAPLFAKHKKELAKTNIGLVCASQYKEGLDVQFRWFGKKDRIHRGIYAEIDYLPPVEISQRELSVYATAFKTDTAELYGNVVKRKIEELACFVLPINQEHLEQIKKAVEEAYTRLSSWTENDLETITEKDKEARSFFEWKRNY